MKRNFFYIIAAMLLIIITIGCKKENVTSVTLNEDNITLGVGATVTLTATVHPEDATNKKVSWTSSHPNVATVANGVVTAKEAGISTITVTTADGGFTATCAVTVTPKQEEGVVINGIKWATRNVAAPGTFTAKPEDAGMFYQWNRITGWSSTNPMINSDGGSTWDNSNPAGDSWDKANDPCPSGWRVPTHGEYESLVSAGSKWLVENGVNGRVFGSDANKAFFPAAGYRNYDDGLLTYVSNNGYYWSSTPKGSNYAYYLGFSSGPISTNDYDRRYGFPVRCVAE